MQEIVEFKGVKIPEKNPNRPNDIYKNNGSEYTRKGSVGLYAPCRGRSFRWK